MRIARYATLDGDHVGVITDDGLLDAGPWAGFQDGGPLEPGRLSPSGPPIALDDVTLLSPTAPSKVVGIGLNYAAHAAEANVDVPDQPMAFLIAPNAVVGSGAPIRPPGISADLDFEAELAVIIGRRATGVSAADSMDHVAGWSCANDVSIRDWQMGGNYIFGKSADGCCPIGPWLTTVDEQPDPSTFRLQGILNDEVVQETSCSDLIWSVPELISFVSRAVTLEPGDVILSGTPSGVGMMRTPPRWLRHGDEFRVAVSGVGELVNRVDVAVGHPVREDG